MIWMHSPVGFFCDKIHIDDKDNLRSRSNNKDGAICGNMSNLLQNSSVYGFLYHFMVIVYDLIHV